VKYMNFKAAVVMSNMTVLMAKHGELSLGLVRGLTIKFANSLW
jgi:hypothetical protein